MKTSTDKTESFGNTIDFYSCGAVNTLVKEDVLLTNSYTTLKKKYSFCFHTVFFLN